MNNYEDEVIKAARLGFSEGLVSMDESMEKLLRLVYRAGYKQATIDMLQKNISEMKHE